MSNTLDTIQAAIVTELLDATNSTGVDAASYEDEQKMSRSGRSGGVTAYVFAEESEVDHEANQYLMEIQTVYISLTGRNRATLHDVAEKVKTLFYKATPLAALVTAGADFMLFKRQSSPIGTVSGAMRVDLAFDLYYETSYTT